MFKLIPCGTCVSPSEDGMSDVSEGNDALNVLRSDVRHNDISEIKGHGDFNHQKWPEEELQQLKDQFKQDIKNQVVSKQTITQS